MAISLQSNIEYKFKRLQNTLVFLSFVLFCELHLNLSNEKAKKTNVGNELDFFHSKIFLVKIKSYNVNIFLLTF